MRSRSPSSGQLSAIPSCAGLITRLACARAREVEIDLAPILRRARLTEAEIADDDIALSVRSQIDCLNSIAEALGDKLLGFHLVQEMDLRRLGFLYYVARSSETLGDALRRTARYSGIVNEGIALKTDVGRALRVRFNYAGVSRSTDRHQIEAWMAGLVRACRDMTGRELTPAGLTIMHRRIPESSELDGFFGRIVRFGADRDEVAFPADAAALPVISADRYLNKLLLGYCDQALSRQKPSSRGALRADVENAIAALLPHAQARLEAVAAKLGISPRTLRRKLAGEGATFAGILEELRLALAKRYLAEHGLSVSRIAWLLGYTEVSGFSHAFRRWTGRTPRADRRARGRAALPTRSRRVQS